MNTQGNNPIQKYLNKIIQGDCLEVMKGLPDKSIDMILCDLPYGTTACSWDTIIPFEPLWEQYKRIIKDNGAIVLMGTQPFTSVLIMSNLDMFKYTWVWNKKAVSNPFLGKIQPLRITEDICIFSKGKTNYYPKMEIRGKMRKKGTRFILKNDNFVDGNGGRGLDTRSYNNSYYPKNIIDITNANRRGKIHPTQKPVELFLYLIETYSKENDTVLDNCIGVGTTAFACKLINRNFIGIELEEKYCKIAEDRLRQEVLDLAPSK